MFLHDIDLFVSLAIFNVYSGVDDNFIGASFDRNCFLEENDPRKNSLPERGVVFSGKGQLFLIFSFYCIGILLVIFSISIQIWTLARSFCHVQWQTVGGRSAGPGLCVLHHFTCDHACIHALAWWMFHGLGHGFGYDHDRHSGEFLHVWTVPDCGPILVAPLVCFAFLLLVRRLSFEHG